MSLSGENATAMMMPESCAEQTAQTAHFRLPDRPKITDRAEHWAPLWSAEISRRPFAP